MAKITTITNPLTGQPVQVDQLEHTAQQIDDVIARALPGGAIDIALAKKLTDPGWWYPVYVAKTGSDTTGDGSESRPYLTIQHAIDVAPRTPCCLRICIGSGTYNEKIAIRDFHGVEISSKDSNNPATVTAITADRCSYVSLERLNISGVFDDTYRASIFFTDVSSGVVAGITCTGSDLSSSPYGGGFRFQDSCVKVYGCTISNKNVAISAVSSIVYLSNTTTGTGNTTALRAGDGYGPAPALIMKGSSAISGAESTEYGGKIW